MKICKSCCGSTTLTVTGCFNFTTPLPLPGASVTIVQASVTIFSGTTNSLGKATFAAAAGVLCNYTISYLGLTTKTGSFTPTSGAFATSVGLTPATAGYHCSSCCPNPFPDTLFAATGLGTLTLAFQAGPPALWFKCTTVTGLATRSGVSPNQCNAASGDVAFGVSFSTACVAQWYQNPICCGSGIPTEWFVSACPAGINTPTSGFTVQCNPLVITFTIPAQAQATSGPLVCTPITNPIGGTVTVTP
jgi:hypothetical protein